MRSIDHRRRDRLSAPVQERRSRPIGRGLAALLALLLAVALAASARAEEGGIGIRYRSADTIYLDAGLAAGVEVGDRFEVVRGDQVVGEIEVVFAAQNSASCRILVEHAPIQTDDAVRRIGEGPPSAPPAAGEEAPAAAEAPAEPPAEPTAPTYEPARESRTSRPARRRTTRVSGSLSVDFESFTDDGPAQLDFERTSARLNLRVRDIGGGPFQLRVRARVQENQRARGLTNRITESESRDRLYEMAFLYEPPEGRFAARAGRIGTSPFVGIGYLDGVLGQINLGRAVSVGAFFGSRPLIDDLGFESFGEKYGVYTRLRSGDGTGRAPFEVFLAGVREEGELDVSREYVTLETRYTPSRRWSFRQRAEIDLNNGWREQLATSSSQLSNLSLSAAARLAETGRFTISYDRYECYRTEETRFISEELFDDLLRQGLRARLSFGKPRGWNFHLNAGLRDREGDTDNTTSFGGGVRHGNVAGWGLSLGADVLAYSNRLTDGYLLNTRAAKRFRAGHQVHLTLGGRVSDDQLLDDERTTQWVRLGGWFELPGNLFSRGEVELTTGDDLEGQRLSLGLGYRF